MKYKLFGNFIEDTTTGETIPMQNCVEMLNKLEAENKRLKKRWEKLSTFIKNEPSMSVEYDSALDYVYSYLQQLEKDGE